MRATNRSLALGSVVLALAACQAVTGGPEARVPGDAPTPRLPRPGTNVAPASNTMRYICRGQTMNGWIAVDYVDDAEGCSTSRMRNGVAVVVPLAKTAVGQSLEVCADERIPNGWHQIQVIVGDPRCPPSRMDSDNASKATVREIRRTR
jgi:hypothetical protein